MDHQAHTFVREEYHSTDGEEIIKESHPHSGEESSLYDKMARAALYAIGFLAPLWVLPITAMPVEINKAFLVYFLISAAFILWLVGRVRESVLVFPKSGFIAASFVVAMVWGLSAAFSAYPRLSLVGMGDESGTLLAVTATVIAAFLFATLFQDAARVLKWFALVLTSAGIVFVFQIWHIAGLPIFWQQIFPAVTSNLLGGWNTLGVFAGLVLLLALALLELEIAWYARSALITLIAGSLFILIAVNFSLLWWLVGVFLVAFLSHLLLTRKDFQGLTIATLVLIILVMFFALAPAVISDWLTGKLGITFIEARPSWGTTLDVIKNAVKENMFLGSGPNTFSLDWLKSRPVSVNSTLFWNSRFTSGVGLLPSFVAGTGILGLLAMLALMLSFFYRGAAIALKASTSKEDGKYLLFVSFFCAAYLWAACIFYTPGFVLFIFAFIISALFVALSAHYGVVSNFHIKLFDNSVAGFVSVMSVIFVLLFSVGVTYYLAQKYLGAYSYGNGARVFAEGKTDEAYNSIVSATRLDEQSLYYRSLVDIDLKRLQEVLSKSNVPADELRANFQAVLSQAINNGQAAIRSGGYDPLNWVALGKVYEAVISFKVNGASQAAMDTYQEAKKRDPYNPEISFLLARVAVQSNDLAKAKEFLTNSIELKSDYAPARFLMVQVESQLGNTQEAIKQAEAAKLLAPNDIGILFQLGLLYYRNGNPVSARNALESAVILNPSYSNARYFLGLIYAQEKMTPEAIAQFEVILALNPGNVEIEKILNNLRSNKPALNTISPPAPSPEKRNEPPIK
jgi:cytochrome c-type biogenesis protein CcmH/NrfG